MTAAVSTPLRAQNADPGLKGQADSYCGQAARFLSAGSLDSALSLAAAALEIYPGYSEALFLRARVELAERAGTRAGMADLRAALAARTWSATDPYAAEQMLAGVLLRTNAFTEARSIAQRLAVLRPDDPVNLLVDASSAAGVGDLSAARKTLDDALARFPLDDSLRLLSASVWERQGKKQAARETVLTGRKVHPDSLPLLLAEARLEPDAKKKAAAAQAYLGKGGADPLAAVLALESSAKADAQKESVGVFLAKGGLARQDLVSRALAAVKASKETTETLKKALAAYSGNRDLDADADGFWEERWTLGSGAVTGWVREPSEDGVARYAADFRDGTPSSLTYTTRQGTLVTLRYSRYPFIESASMAIQGTLVLVPYEMQCPFLATTKSTAVAGATPAIMSAIPTPTIETLTAGAYRQEEYAADRRTPVRIRELARGTISYLEEDADGDGKVDHKVWYDGGQPARGERSLAADGSFPVKETWRAGILAAEEIDTDGDGRVDFRQTYGTRPSRSWDYNEDGVDDCREHAEAGGTVREMSTALNGVFDLRIVFDDGRLVSVARGGVRIPVTADPQRGITWIGQPAGTGPDASLPEGIQDVNGRQYLLFRYGGVVYAEAVR